MILTVHVEKVPGNYFKLTASEKKDELISTYRETMKLLKK